MKTRLLLPLAILATSVHLQAELKLSAIFGDHMVLQRGMAVPVWGWDTPGTEIRVSFAGDSQSTIVGADGKWTVKLASMPADAHPRTLTIEGTTTRRIEDVLVGEVWLCSGQSNMQFPLVKTGGFGGDPNGDIEAAESNLPKLRLITVPNVGAEEPQISFTGGWQASTPKTAGDFSAVGFLFGRYIHRILNVPVGLIDNSWGGSSAEAWVRRSALEGDPQFERLMAASLKQDVKCQTDEARQDFEKAMTKWKIDSEKAKAEFRLPPNAPQSPQAWLTGNKRPGSIFNGALHPIIGYGIKGTIWYQGESNVGRADEYAELFPLLIEQWRKEWGQGDFPFYWVQLANRHLPERGPSSPLAELREAQTRTMRLPNTGQAISIDLGEGRDVHPRNKHDVAARLVRWALAKDYGMQIPYRSPEAGKVTLSGDKARINFDCFGSFLRPFGVDEVLGIELCGPDQTWHPAKARLVGKTEVEASSPEVSGPVAVRYAWASNPVCNLFSDIGLPATPFRSGEIKPAGQSAPKAAASK
jgi:sialate O-acetylesterase